jgi:putative zinc finger protein
MCEFSEKLIAWLDHELPVEASAAIERHVPACAECRHAAAAYRTLNEAIEAYCETAILTAPKRRVCMKARVWRAVFVGTAAAAAAVLLVFLAKPVKRFLWIDSPGAPAAALNKTTVPPIALEKTPIVQRTAVEAPNSVRKPPLAHPSVPVIETPKRGENLWPNQAPVYIAIPADALFPPGALPEGVAFVADVNLRPDGSAQGLQLQPQLVGFQRRGAQP